jgi:hypothetical protein
MIQGNQENDFFKSRVGGIHQIILLYFNLNNNSLLAVWLFLGSLR